MRNGVKERTRHTDRVKNRRMSEKFRRAFRKQTTSVGRFVTCDIDCVFLSSAFSRVGHLVA